MKIFPRSCIDAGVVDSPTNDKKSARAVAVDNEYEYVRKEFGFDYVPPSQYVPSHSFEDSEDGFEAVEMVEQERYQPPPVKVMEPRSDLSGSNYEYDDDDLFIPKPYRSYGSSGRIKSIPRPMEDDIAGYQGPKHLHYQQPIRDNHQHRPTRGHFASNKRVSKRRTYSDEDDVDDLENLEIAAVHTAHSFNSDDSAANMIEERSRASRYNAKIRGKSRERGERQRATGANTPWKENERQELKIIQRSSSRLEDFTTPRYDRKKQIKRDIHPDRRQEYKRAPYKEIDRMESGKRHSNIRHDTESRHHYRSKFDVAPRAIPLDVSEPGQRGRYGEDLWDSRETYDHKRGNFTSSYYATPSGMVASDFEYHEREPIEEPAPQEYHGRELIEEPVPRVARKKNSTGLFNKIRQSVRGKSKKKEKTFDLSGGDKPKLGARGKIPAYATVERTRLDKRKPGAIFAQVPPSMQSDVSFDYDYSRNSNFLRKEPDIPSVLPRTEVASRRHKYAEHHASRMALPENYWYQKHGEVPEYYDPGSDNELLSADVPRVLEISKQSMPPQSPPTHADHPRAMGLHYTNGYPVSPPIDSRNLVRPHPHMHNPEYPKRKSKGRRKAGRY
eukprot:CAMPEP_0178734900 /NCGR_PEP_ID=MMETSP0744-20121128/1596_1 /TAXON_ID=913974 /ORGANISM="Nitzschia punctata, Strain CCMP561" /LENGTH=613 /DNA_ID=CAMNT_0020387223 /DNA_START=9 /DNA_END=1850 /DNA_ORIENTATION=-